MAKIVQIATAAETNRGRFHLFALDEEGNIFLKTFTGDEEVEWDQIDSVDAETNETE